MFALLQQAPFPEPEGHDADPGRVPLALQCREKTSPSCCHCRCFLMTIAEPSALSIETFRTGNPRD